MSPIIWRSHLCWTRYWKRLIYFCYQSRWHPQWSKGTWKHYHFQHLQSTYCIWPAQAIQTQPYPTVYVGNLNNHHEQRCYKTAMQTEKHQSKKLKTNMCTLCSTLRTDLHSDRHPRHGNATPIYGVYHRMAGGASSSFKKFLHVFPYNQHRPVIIGVVTQKLLITSIPCPRWNFRRVYCDEFSTDLDKCLGWMPPTSKNYHRFVGTVISTTKRYIPRKYRKEYTFVSQLETGDQELDELLHSLNARRRQKWTKTVENLNFRASSRLVWSLLGKLGSGTSTQRQNTSFSSAVITADIVETSRAPKDTHTTHNPG